MEIVRIALNTMEKVNSFVHDMNNVEGEAVICYGRYYVDAKSFLGILSLDLTKPLELRIGSWKAEYDNLIQKYLCALDALAIDEPLEYARLYLDGNMQM